MGRQAAGHGFLRAAVQARGDRPIHGLRTSPGGAQGFGQIVRAIDPAAPIDGSPIDQISTRQRDRRALPLRRHVASRARPPAPARRRRGLFALRRHPHHRQRRGHGRDSSISCASRSCPGTPWSARPWPSSRPSGASTRQRPTTSAGASAATSACELPQLPIIPLGVHCDDFDIAPDAREAARAALDLSADDVAALFVGRLVFHAKAHPFPMFRRPPAGRGAHRQAPSRSSCAAGRPMTSIAQLFIDRRRAVRPRREGDLRRGPQRDGA